MYLFQQSFVLVIHPDVVKHVVVGISGALGCGRSSFFSNLLSIELGNVEIGNFTTNLTVIAKGKELQSVAVAYWGIICF